MKGKGTSNHSNQSEATRKTAELEQTIRQMERAVAELDQFIEAEEVKTKIHDMTDPAYSTFARSVRERRDKLCASVRRLEMELDAVRNARLRATTVPRSLVSVPLDC
jgi:septation ring formation regulator EzrA